MSHILNFSKDFSSQKPQPHNNFKTKYEWLHLDHRNKKIKSDKF